MSPYSCFEFMLYQGIVAFCDGSGHTSGHHTFDFGKRGVYTLPLSSIGPFNSTSANPPDPNAEVSQTGITAPPAGGPVSLTPFLTPLFSNLKDNEIDYASLPHTATTEPIVAWKVAELSLLPHVKEGVQFEGVIHAVRYGVEAEAVHHEGWPYAMHEVAYGANPPLHCRHCGFYATTKAALPELFHDYTSRAVTLEVQLHGTVVKHERGWRAQRQTVLGAWVRRHCWRCGEKAAGLVADGKAGLVMPACKYEVGLRVSAFSLSELSGMLGTELRWDDGVIER